MKISVLSSYTLEYVKSRTYHFKRSKPETGSIAEAVWSQLNPIRTHHPVYSFLVIGKKADQVSTINFSTQQPFGDGSFFNWLAINRQFVAYSERMHLPLPINARA